MVARGPVPELRPAAPAVHPGAALRGHRPVWCGHARAMVRVPVVDRFRLAVGETLPGPAVVEERESTAVIPHRADAAVDTAGNLVITLEAAP